MQYDNCPNCFMPLAGAHVCPYCNCDIDGLKTYQGVLPMFTVLNQRYMVGRVLGKGGFGVTYVALDLQTNKLCAIKEYMPAEYSSRVKDGLTIVANPGERAQYIYRHGKEMFYKEAQNLQTLRTNCIVVNILAYFNENNTAYLVMEHLEKDLRTMAKENGGKLDPDYAKVVLVTVASGLMDVHRRGLLHRDISPENIMVAKDGRIVLIDFGAARNYVTQQNKGMSVLLKPGFAPPEQYSSQGKQGTWSDVYALCATFYALVSGKKPLDASFMRNGARMQSLAELGCKVSKKTSDLIEYGMQLDYRQRCPDFKTLLDLIDISVSPKKFSKQQEPNPRPKSDDIMPPAGKVVWIDDVKKKHWWQKEEAKQQVPQQRVVQRQIPQQQNVWIPQASAHPKQPQGSSGSAQQGGTQKRYATVTLLDVQGRPSCKLYGGQTLTIGRAPERCELVDNGDKYISKEHCKISLNLEEGCFYVTDISANGTFYETGVQLRRQETTRIIGDTVIFLATKKHRVSLQISG